MIKALQCIFAGAILLGAVPSASADTLSGQLQYHNQVIFQTVTVEAGQGMLVWTDSWVSEGGFDSVLAVWNGSGALIGLSDDNAQYPGMGRRDAAVRLEQLEPGMYTIGLSRFANVPMGPLALGYWLSDEAPRPVQGAQCNIVCATYRMNWVVGETLPAPLQSPIPEPSTYAMLLAGLGVAGLAARRQSRRRD